MAERLIWLVPVVVAAAGLWRPRAAVLVLVASLPLFGVGPGGPYLGALDAAALLVILAGLRAPRAERGLLRWPVVAFAVCGLASLVPLAYAPPSWAPGVLLDLARSLPGVEGSSLLYSWRAGLNLLLGAGLFWSVRRLIDARSARSVGLALGAGLVALELLGIGAWAGLVDLGGYRALVQTRMHSLFFNPGWLAEYVVVAAPVAVGALLAGGRRARLLGQLTLLLSLVVLLFAQQRGGWLTAVVQVAVLALWWRLRAGGSLGGLRRAVVPLAAGLVLLVAATAVVAPSGWRALYRRATHLGTGLGVRTHYWGAALELGLQRPVLGWGLGSFTPAYDLLRPPRTRGARRHRGSAHSLVLNTFAEQGVLGVCALLILAAGLVLVLRAALGQGGGRAPPMAIGLAVAFVGFFVYGAVQYMFYLKNIAWLFWVLAAVVSRLAPVGASRRLDRVALALVALVLLWLPYRLLAVEPLAGAGDHAFGFHEPEPLRGRQSFRWAEARAARRVECDGETLILELANGHPLAAERPIEVTVSIDGREIERLEIRGGWESHRFPVTRPASGWLVLGLDTEPSFRPFRDFRGLDGVALSNDIRSLAVAVREPRCE